LLSFVLEAYFLSGMGSETSLPSLKW